ncbi:MAG: hypothetical protein WCP39_01960 [Chlamydiota bacterium]
MKRYWLLLFFPLYLLGNTNEDWIEYHSRQGGCSLLFPELPSHIKEHIALGEHSTLPYDVYVANHQESIFLLLIAHYPMELTKEQADKGLQGFIQGLLFHKQEEIVENRFTPNKEKNWIDFFLKTKNRILQGKAFIVGNKLYLLAVEGSVNGYQKEIPNKFLQSFVLKQKQN